MSEFHESIRKIFEDIEIFLILHVKPFSDELSYEGKLARQSILGAVRGIKSKYPALENLNACSEYNNETKTSSKSGNKNPNDLTPSPTSNTDTGFSSNSNRSDNSITSAKLDKKSKRFFRKKKNTLIPTAQEETPTCNKGMKKKSFVGINENEIAASRSTISDEKFTEKEQMKGKLFKECRSLESILDKTSCPDNKNNNVNNGQCGGKNHLNYSSSSKKTKKSFMASIFNLTTGGGTINGGTKRKNVKDDVGNNNNNTNKCQINEENSRNSGKKGGGKNFFFPTNTTSKSGGIPSCPPQGGVYKSIKRSKENIDSEIDCNYGSREENTKKSVHPPIITAHSIHDISMARYDPDVEYEEFAEQENVIDIEFDLEDDEDNVVDGDQLSQYDSQTALLSSELRAEDWNHEHVAHDDHTNSFEKKKNQLKDSTNTTINDDGGREFINSSQLNSNLRDHYLKKTTNQMKKNDSSANLVRSKSMLLHSYDNQNEEEETLDDIKKDENPIQTSHKNGQILENDKNSRKICDSRNIFCRKIALHEFGDGQNEIYNSSKDSIQISEDSGKIDNVTPRKGDNLTHGSAAYLPLISPRKSLESEEEGIVGSDIYLSDQIINEKNDKSYDHASSLLTKNSESKDIGVKEKESRLPLSPQSKVNRLLDQYFSSIINVTTTEDSSEDQITTGNSPNITRNASKSIVDNNNSGCENNTDGSQNFENSSPYSSTLSIDNNNNNNTASNEVGKNEALKYSKRSLVSDNNTTLNSEFDHQTERFQKQTPSRVPTNYFITRNSANGIRVNDPNMQKPISTVKSDEKSLEKREEPLAKIAPQPDIRKAQMVKLNYNIPRSNMYESEANMELCHRKGFSASLTHLEVDDDETSIEKFRDSNNNFDNHTYVNANVIAAHYGYSVKQTRDEDSEISNKPALPPRLIRSRNDKEDNFNINVQPKESYNKRINNNRRQRYASVSNLSNYLGGQTEGLQDNRSLNRYDMTSPVRRFHKLPDLSNYDKPNHLIHQKDDPDNPRKNLKCLRKSCEPEISLNAKRTVRSLGNFRDDNITMEGGDVQNRFDVGGKKIELLEYRQFPKSFPNTTMCHAGKQDIRLPPNNLENERNEAIFERNLPYVMGVNYRYDKHHDNIEYTGKRYNHSDNSDIYHTNNNRRYSRKSGIKYDQSTIANYYPKQHTPQISEINHSQRSFTPDHPLAIDDDTLTRREGVKMQRSTHAKSPNNWGMVYEDELKLKRGEPVYVTNKKYDSHGWWMGVSLKTGERGLIPKLSLLPTHKSSSSRLNDRASNNLTDNFDANPYNNREPQNHYYIYCPPT